MSEFHIRLKWRNKKEWKSFFMKKMRFLTNNPKKVVGLEGYGLKIVELVPIKSDPNPHNERYLETKRLKMGHLL